MKKLYVSVLMGILWITTPGFAQKMNDLIQMKKESKNELFHRLDKAPCTPAFESEGY